MRTAIRYDSSVTIAAGALLLAALPPYAGTVACLKCHGEYAGQTATHHARALRPISEIAAAFLDRPIRERNGVEFEYRRAPEGLAVTARVGNQRAAATLEWAVGSGAQAFTPVGRSGGLFFEHRISLYAGRPGLTMGHPASADSSAQAALGIPQPPETITRCFNCHATGVRGAADFAEPGVNCERCHGPGAAHAAAPATAKLLNPGRFSAPASVQICAGCHRSPEPAQRKSTKPEIEDPVSIRFQPIGLIASRCFQASGKLSCLTCHDPHANARRNDAAFYSAKCQGCHAGAPTSRCARANETNCLSCHMKSSSPVPYLRFTDHRIR